ncbi:MAG: hypothetical protein AAB783_01215 [Patescibacteria group bacterium]
MVNDTKLKLDELVTRAKNAKSEFERTVTNLVRGMDKDLAALDKQSREAGKAIKKEEKRFADAMDLEVLKLFKE